MKQKFKSYAFCFGVCVAVIGAFVTIGNVLGFKVNEIALTSVATAVLGVFVSLGIVQKDSDTIDILNDNEEFSGTENKECCNEEEDAVKKTEQNELDDKN